MFSFMFFRFGAFLSAIPRALNCFPFCVQEFVFPRRDCISSHSPLIRPGLPSHPRWYVFRVLFFRSGSFFPVILCIQGLELLHALGCLCSGYSFFLSVTFVPLILRIPGIAVISHVWSCFALRFLLRMTFAVVPRFLVPHFALQV